jgi:uncharacterized integral membrane protein (TIGR00698 family)
MSALSTWRGYAPGLIAVTLLAWASIQLHTLPQLGAVSALMIAIVLGMLVRNTVGLPAACAPGIRFSLRRILRFAIVLLGFQLSARQIAEVGGMGLFVVAVTLAAAFCFTTWLGRRLGVDRKLSELIAAGTSICGASAIVATNAVTEGSDEDVAYAIAVVTLFGCASMLLYPFGDALMHMPAHAYGLWAGASIHETAQVLAASFQGGAVSGRIGAVTKLSRVMLLAPVVLGLGWAARRRDEAAYGKPDDAACLSRGEAAPSAKRRAVPVPLFLLGFIAAMGINSAAILPASATRFLVTADQFLLALSLGAMGLETSFRKVREAGLRPMLLGSGAWLFISAFSFALIRCLDW